MTKKCIVFVDIAGSTNLYEEHGNKVAEKAISTSLGEFAKIIVGHNGSVVKYIGDEVLCYFKSTADAVKMAIAVQQLCDEGINGVDFAVSVRIGMDYGEVIESKDDDIFGDAVNTAARMVGYARAEQIIVNQNIVDQLPDDLKHYAHQLDKTRVKGKEKSINIFRVQWDQSDDDVTRIASALDFDQGDSISDIKDSLELTYLGKEYEYSGIAAEFRIGRDPNSGIPVQSALASRRHSYVTVQREKFVYYDASTNGSTIILDNGMRFFLRRENMSLFGSGKIIFGEAKEGDKIDPKDVFSYKLVETKRG